MRTAKFLAAALVAATAAIALPQSATSAPLMTDTILSSAVSASSDVENVQYYRRGYYGHRHHGYGGTAAGVGIGLAAGAILGGAIAASQAQAQQNAAYCAQRYRSYDPRSGTYLNRDGNRYPCP
ncbi:MAG: BA14K family protein [Afipia sp.]|jgi:hypothetical protein|nr:BA14K family protein [Afipia sp.]MCR6733026.1 BA14K family protein [Afipia sp.]